MNINFERIGNKNSSVYGILSKNFAYFFSFHGQKGRQIFEPIKIVDVIFGHET